MAEFMTIEWHRENIRNRESTLARQQERLEQLKKDVSRDSYDLEVYKEKVRRAVAEGRTKFDADRFNVKINVKRASRPSEPK